MPLTTLKELRDNIASTTRETQVGSLIDGFINLAGIRIHTAAPWTWLREKQTFSTVVSQESYALDSEVDRIGFLRQLTTPRKLLYLPDPLFYQWVVDPENQSTGTPRIYRQWEETGFSANLAAADTIYVVSSSASDGSTFTVRVTGRNSSGEEVTETLTLNGTTNVTSSTTFAASGLKQVSKSARTTGTISVSRTTGATLLSELEPDNLAPRFKQIQLYPIPSAVITMYLEYYKRYRYLVHDTDTPQMDSQWNWVLREGALVEMWDYKHNDAAKEQAERNFLRGLGQMLKRDFENLDYIPVLQRRRVDYATIRRLSDSVNDNYPSYALSI